MLERIRRITKFKVTFSCLDFGILRYLLLLETRIRYIEVAISGVLCVRRENLSDARQTVISHIYSEVSEGEGVWREIRPQFPNAPFIVHGPENPSYFAFFPFLFALDS